MITKVDITAILESVPANLRDWARAEFFALARHLRPRNERQYLDIPADFAAVGSIDDDASSAHVLIRRRVGRYLSDPTEMDVAVTWSEGDEWKRAEVSTTVRGMSDFVAVIGAVIAATEDRNAA